MIYLDVAREARGPPLRWVGSRIPRAWILLFTIKTVRDAVIVSCCPVLRRVTVDQLSACEESRVLRQITL